MKAIIKHINQVQYRTYNYKLIKETYNFKTNIHKIKIVETIKT